MCTAVEELKIAILSQLNRVITNPKFSSVNQVMVGLGLYFVLNDLTWKSSLLVPGCSNSHFVCLKVGIDNHNVYSVSKPSIAIRGCVSRHTYWGILADVMMRGSGKVSGETDFGTHCVKFWIIWLSGVVTEERLWSLSYISFGKCNRM